MKFLPHNLEIYEFDFRVYGIDTKNTLQLCRLTDNLALYQKRVYYKSVEIFTEVLEYVTEFVVDKSFILTL
jgi:hypothetical protein